MIGRPQPAKTVTFGPFELDLRGCCLTRQGRQERLASLQEEAAPARDRQRIVDCVRHIGEQCTQCGNPFWKYAWLTAE